jgi:hypothetical protein
LKLNKLNLTAVVAAVGGANETGVDLLLVEAAIAFALDDEFGLGGWDRVQGVDVGEGEGVHRRGQMGLG